VLALGFPEEREDDHDDLTRSVFGSEVLRKDWVGTGSGPDRSSKPWNGCRPASLGGIAIPPDTLPGSAREEAERFPVQDLVTPIFEALER